MEKGGTKVRKKIEGKLIPIYKKYKLTRWIIKLYYYLVSLPLDNIENFLERDVILKVSEIHSEKDNKYHPYIINGFVVKGNQSYSLDKIPYEDIDMMIETFSEELNKPIDFEIEFGGGWKQEVRLTPKLRKIMVKRLIELKDKYGDPSS